MMWKQSTVMMSVMVSLSLGIGVLEVQAQSGSLEPPGSAVNGSGDPVATTQTQPSWDQNLPANERFKLVLGGEAVLDRETGLVWERAPQTTTHTWVNARRECLDSRTIGAKKGWRLPSVHELASLLVTNASPALPTGHPFSNIITSDLYQSATELAGFPDRMWSVNFVGPFARVADSEKSRLSLVWCVRGGGPLSVY